MSHRKLIILPKRNVSAFLADMPDASPLYSLLLPGMFGQDDIGYDAYTNDIVGTHDT